MGYEIWQRRSDGTEVLEVMIGAGGGFSSIGPQYGLEDAVDRFSHKMIEAGSAVVYDKNLYTPWRNCVGTGSGTYIAHDDVRWCESRFEQGSMAAYYENDLGGWWNGRAALTALKAHLNGQKQD